MQAIFFFFCKHGPKFSFIRKCKVSDGFEFCTDISFRTNSQFFQMGSESVAHCLLLENELGIEDGGERGNKVCSYVGKHEGFGIKGKKELDLKKLLCNSSFI